MMLIKVYKSIFSKLKKIIVHKREISNKDYTYYPQNINACNSLKQNKIKDLSVSYDHIHTSYYNY